MVDSCPMNALKLRFEDRSQPELPLGMGVYGIGRRGKGESIGLLDDAAATKVRFCVDRRGVWLTVDEGTRGVHVNGREIRRLAMLRVGDAIYVDGVEMRLVASIAPGVPGAVLAEQPNGDADPRIVLRGVGGQYHGRSFTLEQPRLIGRSRDSDIRIDEPAFADRHARLELIGEQVVLRDLGSSEGSIVNGEQVRDALLQTGDQIVFDAHHRFVVEAPSRAKPAIPAVREVEDAGPDVMPYAAVGPTARRLPWLLLAALILAGLLSALLLFGSA